MYTYKYNSVQLPKSFSDRYSVRQSAMTSLNKHNVVVVPVNTSLQDAGRECYSSQKRTRNYHCRPNYVRHPFMLIAHAAPIQNTRQVHVIYNKLLATCQKERMELLMNVAASFRHASYVMIRLTMQTKVRH